MYNMYFFFLTYICTLVDYAQFCQGCVDSKIIQNFMVWGRHINLDFDSISKSKGDVICTTCGNIISGGPHVVEGYGNNKRFYHLTNQCAGMYE